MPYRIVTVLLCLLMLLPAAIAEPAVNGEDPRAVSAQIENLEREIQQFRDKLKKTQGKRSQLELRLESNEKQIGGILKKVKTVQLEINTLEKKLAKLRRDQGQLNTKKTQQQTLIGQQIRASFELGQQPYLKLLLNLEDPHEVSRMLTYYDYFNRARTTQIAQYETVLSQLNAITQDIDDQNKQLVVTRTQLDQQKAGLVEVRQQRQQNLAQLNREIKQTGKTLQQRLEDRKQLEALLTRINTSINSLQPPKDAELFTERKGKLLLPVAGRLVHKFGKQRNSKLKWNGVFIEAPRGTPVKAVHYGQVVFSDWLRGFGLLIIVNHGQGYLSLYGHNQVLYRQTGDWIAAGEVISDVGDSGGQTKPGLYFEIRTAGKPSDPQVWCRVRPANSGRG